MKKQFGMRNGRPTLIVGKSLNRETQRQIQRLNKLADFIEANPDKFSIVDSTRCIVGIGQKLNRTKRSFQDYYGVSADTKENLYTGYFKDINSRFSVINFNWAEKVSNTKTRKSAVSILRWIANQKALDKVV